ncbi:mitochondrial glycoprotein [Stachybotrys elegans]|uniref:Mitochondrial glycoprotein n=1 Tax=Stachybotrys elegans TaxID=80388 RepID=A0A8K0T056_9HYPO|nr:mitochondrial glycoprotein [Stachybotrys elegans]
MMSMRSFARAAPRAISRVATASLRQTARPTFIKTSPVSAMRPVRAAFSTTVQRRANETDEELLSKLESEIQLEEEMKASEQQPASIKDFLDNSPFELIDTPGHEVVKLVRTYGDEKITVSFSIADVTNFEGFNEESPLEDEDLTDEALQNPNKQSHVRSTGGARSAEAEEDMEEDFDDVDEQSSAPINLSILVEKPGKAPGALNIEMTAHEGNIWVENLSYHEDAKLVNPDTLEAERKSNAAYPGPPFGTLDEDLQILVERYLDERGVTQALGVFVPDYVDVKEQREYVRWLNNVKGFVAA